MDCDHYGVQRRVAGDHDVRLDGVSDILGRCRDASVLDLGCNRGMVSMELARNGASLICGLDYDSKSIEVARSIFADCRSVEYYFEVADLSQGGKAVAEALPSIKGTFTIILCLAILHKLRKQMTPEAKENFCRYLGKRCHKYFVWRGTEDQQEQNEIEMELLDRTLIDGGLRRVHWSRISGLGLAAVWEKTKW